jgi:hypothetical protein
VAALAWLAVLLAALAVPPGEATTPSLPAETRAVALVGEPVSGLVATLHVPFRLRGSPDLSVRLHASDGIEVLDPPTAHVAAAGEGRTDERTWHVRAVRPGFWSLALSAVDAEGRPYPIGGGCCGVGWSGDSAGAWSAAGDLAAIAAALPDAHGQASVAAQVTDAAAGVVHLTYDVTAADWVDPAGVRPEMGPGHQAARSGPRALSLERMGRDLDLEVPDGGHAFAYRSATWTVTFPAPRDLPAQGHTWQPASLAGDLDCRNLRIERHGDRAAVAATWACADGLGAAVHGAPASASGAMAGLLAALGVAAARRVKG